MTELQIVAVLVRWVALLWSIVVAYRYPGRRSLVLFSLVLVSVLIQAGLVVAMGEWGSSGDLMPLALNGGSVLFSGLLLAAVSASHRAMRELAEARAQGLEATARFEAQDLASREQLRARARQQEALANLGRRILAAGELDEILDDAVHAVARTLEVSGAELYELSRHRPSLVLRAASGQVGQDAIGTPVSASSDHLLGSALAREGAVRTEDFRSGPLRRPPLLPYVSALSGMAVTVAAGSRPFGVLATHAQQAHRFGEDDALFLQSVANLLSAAITQAQSRAEIDRVRERAFLAQKLEALGRLSGGIAHDLNNVLHAIVGHTQLAKGALPEGSPQEHNLRQVLTAAQRARELVQQVLAFGLRGKSERRPIDVASIVDEVVILMRSVLGSRIEIQRSVLSPDVSVVADSTQIYQVLVNLCTNAGNAMRPDGGRLDVEVDSVELAQAEADLRGAPPGPYVRIRIQDSGHGIRPEIRDRVFEPFFSAGATEGAAGEGTGMGLAVVHGIVESHGGSIRFESEVGSGTCFEVLLPRSGFATERASAAPPPDPSHVRVLFVDDEPSLVSMAEQALGGRGYQIVGFTSSQRALEHFRKEPDAFDVVVLDQNMPGLRGDELAKRLIDTRPGLPILLYTGYTDEITPGDARAMGVREFLTKPLTIEDLASAVQRAMEPRV